MKRFSFKALAKIYLPLCACLALAACQNITPSNEFRIRTRSLRNVSELVELLVSPVPAKHPEGEFDLRGDDSIGSLLHPQVEAAYNRLVKMGTAIYPQLVKHLRDDRYSYSRVETAWNNYSIGDAMVEIGRASCR